MRQSFFFIACMTLSVLFMAGCDAPTGEPLTDCQINEGPCVKMIDADDITAVFDIQPKPVKVMTNLSFSLSLLRGGTPLTDAGVRLDLTMPGMLMAENRIMLQHKGNGRYEGQGVIVRCRSGKRVWKARFVLIDPHAGSADVMSTEYTFAVGKQ